MNDINLQAAMQTALDPTGDAAWLLRCEGYDPLLETSIESRFAISNGFLGIRAQRAITRGTRWVVPARTYVAGLFDTPGNEPGAPGLVAAADWLQVRILLASEPLVHHPCDVLSHRMTLDMKRGALLSQSRLLRPACQDGPDLGLHVRTLRLVSLDDRAIGLQLIQFEIEAAGECEITFEAAFEGIHLGLVTERMEPDLGVWRTHRPGKRLAMATASSLWIDGLERPPTQVGNLQRSWTWICRPAQIVCFARFVAVTRADMPTEDPGRDAREKLGAARGIGWQGVVAAQAASWSDRWRCSDVAVEGDDAAQQALRFAIYHLNGAANPTDPSVSIGARALTGDDYRGHVFWDTEIYLLPFYTLTWPEAARSLLLYRFRTLDGARAKAAGMGWRGALYAWESADTGEDTTPEHVIAPDRQVIAVLSGTQEQHISADVAYAVWHYWQATGDDAFLRDAGAEILLETARFWSSRAQLEADGKSHIRGVIGPDEYHEHVDDNAFTNGMAQWNILRALEVVTLLRERWPERWASLASSLALKDAELAQWSRIAAAMATGLDPVTGLIEQFAGFYGLEKIDLSQYAGRSVPMDVVLGRQRTQRSQVIKQADVVALLGLLPDVFSHETAAKNFHYYEPRCSHGSSLSAAMHGLVAARLGLTETALRFFRQTAKIDLNDATAAIDGGVHIAALGGIWQMAVLGFAGLSLQPDRVALDPQLPVNWTGLGFRFQWRGRHLKIRLDATRQRVEATLEAGEPMILMICGKPHDLRVGTMLKVRVASLGRGDCLAKAHQ